MDEIVSPSPKAAESKKPIVEIEKKVEKKAEKKVEDEYEMCDMGMFVCEYELVKFNMTRNKIVKVTQHTMQCGKILQYFPSEGLLVFLDPYNVFLNFYKNPVKSNKKSNEDLDEKPKI